MFPRTLEVRGDVDINHEHARPGGHEPWNKGRVVDQKPPLKLQEIWPIRIRLQLGKRLRDLALLGVAIDSKLCGCDLFRLRLQDVVPSNHVLARPSVVKCKTGRPVRFELSKHVREAVLTWIGAQHLTAGSLLFPSRSQLSSHLSTR